MLKKRPNLFNLLKKIRRKAWRKGWLTPKRFDPSLIKCIQKAII